MSINLYDLNSAVAGLAPSVTSLSANLSSFNSVMSLIQTAAMPSISSASASVVANTSTINAMQGAISNNTLSIQTLSNTVNNNTSSYATLSTTANQMVALNNSNSFLTQVNSNASFVPLSNNVYDLGSSNLRWRNLYLSGNAISFGNGVTIAAESWAYLNSYVLPQASLAASSNAVALAVTLSNAILATGVANEHSAYIVNKQLYTWGNNSSGQLGLGSSYSNVPYVCIPTPVPGVSNAASSACGYNFTVVANIDGSCLSFGNNAYGQLGDTTVANRNSPVAVVGVSNVVQVACGYSHSLFMTPSNVYGFGAGTLGQLGCGSNVSVNSTPQSMVMPSLLPGMSNTPVIVAGFLPNSIYCGNNFSYILCANGYAFGCGQNTNYQLGSSNTSLSSINVPGLTTYSQSGSNLGLAQIVTMATGGNHVVASLSNGNLYTWGAGLAGQLGSVTPTASSTPTQVYNYTINDWNWRAVQIAAGAQHTLIRTSSNVVYGLGDNSYGQLGVGSNMASYSNNVAILQGYSATSVASGARTSYICLSNSLFGTGRVAAFGDNALGQCADAVPPLASYSNTAMARYLPSTIYQGFTPKRIATSQATSCYNFGYTDSDGTSYFIGQNSYSGLPFGGTPTSSNYTYYKPCALIPRSLASININYLGSTIAVDTIGNVWTWGNAASYLAGNGGLTPSNNSVPQNVSAYGSLVNRKAVAAYVSPSPSGVAAFAIDTTGCLHSWGTSYLNSLGSNYNYPTAYNNGYSINMPYNISACNVYSSFYSLKRSVSGASTGTMAFAFGSDGSSWGQMSIYAIDTLGSIHSWGYNNQTFGDRQYPQIFTSGSITSTTCITCIASSAINVAAVDTNGKVHTWGNNSSYILGNSNNSANYSPTNISSIAGSSLVGKFIQSVQNASGGMIALDNNGDMHGWGNLGGYEYMLPTFVPNTLHLNQFNFSYNPMAMDNAGNMYSLSGPITNPTAFTGSTYYNYPTVWNNSNITFKQSVSSGFGEHKLFSTNDPTRILAAGSNNFSQLGDGTTIFRNSGVTLSFPSSVQSMAGSATHSAVVLSSGAVYAWGDNSFGQCGKSNISIVSIPTVIPGISSAADVKTGYKFTIVRMQDGTLQSFGDNSSGQLGIPSVTSNVSTPTFGSLMLVSSLSCGTNFAAAILSSGSLYTWGNNASGKTGLGTTTGFTAAPALASLSNETAKYVACGDSHMLVVSTKNNLYSCGLNTSGQLGIDPTTNAYLATLNMVTFPRLTLVQKVVAGAHHSAITLANSRVATFGWNSFGQLGYSSSNSWNPAVTLSNNNVVDVQCGTQTTFLSCVDNGFDAVTSYGEQNTNVGLKLMSSGSTTQTAAAQVNSLIDNRGKLYTLGDQSNKQLGLKTVNGESTSSLSQPTTISTLPGSSLYGRVVTSSSMSENGGLAIDISGNVHVWTNSTYSYTFSGSNNMGDSGTASNLSYSPSLSNTTGSLFGKVCKQACIMAYTCAVVDTVGNLHMWGGYNLPNQGNAGGSNYYPMVSKLGSLSNAFITSVGMCSYGNGTCVAIDSTGSYHVWGDNNYGQFGNQTTSTTQNYTPSSNVEPGVQMASVSCGYAHVACVTTTGQVYAWGMNNYTQVGNTASPSTYRYRVQYGSLANQVVKQVSCGDVHTLALAANGTVHAWGQSAYVGNNSGYNNYNPTGSVYSVANPVMINGFGSLTTSTVVTQILATYASAYALDTNQNIHVWGYNGSYQFGIKSGGSYIVPIISFSNFTLTGNNPGSNVPLFVNFTGQHRCFVKGKGVEDLRELEGLIVVADNNEYETMDSIGQNAITQNDSLPVVSLSSQPKDRRPFGVISMNVEPFATSDVLTPEAMASLQAGGDVRAEINAVGEGAMWVIETAKLLSGDYVTTSAVPGYGMKQDEDCVKNYTVAKITMDCDFEPAQIPIMETRMDPYGDPVLDPMTGAIAWFPSNDHTEPAYKIRYVEAATGRIVNIEDYTSRAGSEIVRAAFVGVTYKC